MTNAKRPGPAGGREGGRRSCEDGAGGREGGRRSCEDGAGGREGGRRSCEDGAGGREGGRGSRTDGEAAALDVRSAWPWARALDAALDRRREELFALTERL